MDWYDGVFAPIDTTINGKHRSYKRLARYKNERAWRAWFTLLIKKALDRYDFENLPATVNERVLKLSLLYYASVCFFDKDGSLMALPGGAGTNGVTVYGDFTHCYVYGRNGFNEQIPLWMPGEEELPFLAEAYAGQDAIKPRGVWFRENIQKFPFLEYCIMYADELADSWRKITVARKNAASPYIFVTKEELIETIKRAINSRDNNEEIIAISSGIFAPENVQLEQLQSTVEAIKAFTDLIEWYMNQFESLCGKNSNANPDKKERLIVDEVNANNETTASNIDDTIRYIQQGLDEVNKHFGTDIRVVKRQPEGEEAGNESDIQ